MRQYAEFFKVSVHEEGIEIGQPITAAKNWKTGSIFIPIRKYQTLFTQAN